MDTVGDPLGAVAITSLAAGSAGDNRVLLIKIADRLHNMRTIGYLPASKQVNKSVQTLQVQVPVARAFGADAIGVELTDLASPTPRRHQPPPPASAPMPLCAWVRLPRACRPPGP